MSLDQRRILVPRYVFLRGVTPTNLKMVGLKQMLETAGFTHVKNLLSGNVAFSAQKTPNAALDSERKCLCQNMTIIGTF
jgi:uncharacterized protein (DUF1697 family)